MEQRFESAQTKIEKPEKRELEKDTHQAVIEAVDALAGLLKKETLSEEQMLRIKDIYLTISKEIIRKHRHLYDPVEYDFFRDIPFLLKVSGLETDRDVGVDINALSDKGRSLLTDGLKRTLLEKKELPELNQKEADYLFQALSDVYQADDYYAAVAVYDFLEKYKDNLEAHKEEYAEATAFLESSEARHYFAGLVYSRLFKYNTFLDREPRAKESVIGEIKRYGLDKKSAEDILNSWLTLTERHLWLPPYFNRMDDLERNHSGIIKFLYEKFGIRNFHRYPLDLLSDQLENFDDKEKPYGIIINPTNDRDGALSQNVTFWYRLYRQLKDFGYNLRVVECDGKLEVARRFIGFERKYGDRHKISFAFIGGHGTESSIRFGGDRPVNILHIEDLMGKGVRRSSKFFEANPRVVLNSCSTGTDKGIGKKLSKVLGAKVVAPDRPTSLKDIEVSRRGNILNFNIEYGKKGSKKTFAKGRKR